VENSQWKCCFNISDYDFSVYYDYICFAGGKRVKFKFYDATGKRVKLEVVLTQFKGIV